MDTVILEKIKATPESMHGKLALNRNNACFCIMGLIAECCGYTPRHFFDNFYSYDGESTIYLGPEILKKIGLTHNQQQALITCNDHLGLTFKELAEFIERDFKHVIEFAIEPQQILDLVKQLSDMFRNMYMVVTIEVDGETVLHEKGHGSAEYFESLSSCKCKIDGHDIIEILEQHYGKKVTVTIYYP